MRSRRAFGLVGAAATLLVLIIPTVASAAPESRAVDIDPDAPVLECSVLWVPPCAISLVDDLRARTVALKLDDVTEIGDRAWLGRSLLSQLDGATRALQRENPVAAAGHLRAFQGEVRARAGVDRGIFIYEAYELVAQAEVVIHSIVGYAPGPPQTDNLNFLGGSVTEHPKVYITYWGFGSSYSSTQDPDGMIPVLEGFLSNIGGTPYLEPLTQYYGQEYDGIPGFGGVTITKYFINNDSNLVKGIWYDGGNSMPKNPSSEDVQKEVRRSVQHFGYDEDAIYYIVTAPGRTWTANACAYHASTERSEGKGSTIIYVDLPYQPEVCKIGLTGRDATTILAFHELVEAMTDPRYGDKPSPWGSNFAWVATDGRENADKCGTLEGYAKLDVPLGGETYAIQAHWSNKDNACVYF